MISEVWRVNSAALCKGGTRAAQQASAPYTIPIKAAIAATTIALSKALSCKSLSAVAKAVPVDRVQPSNQLTESG